MVSGLECRLRRAPSKQSMIGHRRFAVALLATLLCFAVPAVRHAPRPVRTSGLPAQLSDEAFWQLVTDFSEPNGYFRSDNFLSNERGYQQVIPDLLMTLPIGGVYLGVGPEQNFTYVAALRPRMAFIIDIRRGNLDEQLLYKAFFELSANRAEFLSRLFARPQPAGLKPEATVEELFSAYAATPSSFALFGENYAAARDLLVKTHRFALRDEDISGLAYVYNAFYKGGPELNYTFSNGFGGGSGGGGFGRGGFGGGRFGGPFPTYADLMLETDGRGVRRSYLATEEGFQTVRQLEFDNAIVPIVGDFGGPKAVRAVGRYLTEHAATVTAFYTSNVEQYLFQGDGWTKFYPNVATLPLDETSTFIRSISNRGFQYQYGGPGFRASTRTSSMIDLTHLFAAGRIAGYYDVISLSR
jgi:hypothetical protein